MPCKVGTIMPSLVVNSYKESTKRSFYSLIADSLSNRARGELGKRERERAGEGKEEGRC